MKHKSSLNHFGALTFMLLATSLHVLFARTLNQDTAEEAPIKQCDIVKINRAESSAWYGVRYEAPLGQRDYTPARPWTTSGAVCKVDMSLTQNQKCTIALNIAKKILNGFNLSRFQRSDYEYLVLNQYGSANDRCIGSDSKLALPAKIVRTYRGPVTFAFGYTYDGKGKNPSSPYSYPDGCCVVMQSLTRLTYSSDDND